MRPFYITKGRCGYYRIRLVDMASGLIVCDRSSRTSDRKAAERLAWEWVRDGISPVTKKSSEKKSLDTKPSRAVSAPVENSMPLGGLSESEELALLKLLAKKHGFSLGSESSVMGATKNVTVTDKNTAEKGERDFAFAKITDADLPLSLSCKKFDAGIFNGIKIADFITDFWTEEKSPYYEQQKAHRKDINGTHCQNMRDMVKRYWIPFFGSSTVDSLTSEILNKFFIYLAADKGLKSSTVNKVLNSAAVPFKFYCKNHKISSNPMDGIERFGCDKTERGILTRKKNSPWSELNKERVRRLEKLGLMTDAGRAVLPDMSEQGFVIDSEILALLQSDEQTWHNFQSFPPLYQRVRVDAVQREKGKSGKKAVYESTLAKLIENTRQGIMYGEWNDGGRLLEY